MCVCDIKEKQQRNTKSVNITKRVETMSDSDRKFKRKKLEICWKIMMPVLGPLRLMVSITIFATFMMVLPCLLDIYHGINIFTMTFIMLLLSLGDIYSGITIFIILCENYLYFHYWMHLDFFLLFLFNFNLFSMMIHIFVS